MSNQQGLLFHVLDWGPPLMQTILKKCGNGRVKNNKEALKRKKNLRIYPEEQTDSFFGLEQKPESSVV